MTLAAARRLTKPKLLRALALAALVAAFLATVFTVPASAQSYRVTVELADGTLTEVVLDLPEGTTLEEILTHPDLPGTPISLEPVAPEPPGDEPTTTDPVPPDAPAGEPPPGDTPPGELPPAPAPAPGDPGAPGIDSPADPPADDGDDTAPTVIDERKLDGAPDGRRRDQWIELVRDGGDERRRGRHPRLRRHDGMPTRANPGFAEVLPGPSTAVGVPNFMIDKFRVPPFLLSIYQAAGIAYDVRRRFLT